MTAKEDLLNNPKFKARVAKLEGNQYIKVFKDPLLVKLDDERDYYVIAIGINDSYLVVTPRADGCILSVFWTKHDQFSQPGPLHEAIQMSVLNWLMMHSLDNATEKMRHGALNVQELAFKGLFKKLGQKYFLDFPKEVSIAVQGTVRDGIKNPYNR